ncbi:hypothetical protein CEXT_158621 [Caerostris extrusa]|uniref:Uncharacterized protein n=1 Tax=Caerostris extrusa TaxID=172846 RepID=A0AAV4UKQ8_CAEEX|nr:hypothetical protein CEXT_158621 [Caerostris extrusa]
MLATAWKVRLGRKERFPGFSVSGWPNGYHQEGFNGAIGVSAVLPSASKNKPEGYFTLDLQLKVLPVIPDSFLQTEVEQLSLVFTAV